MAALPSVLLLLLLLAVQTVPGGWEHAWDSQMRCLQLVRTCERKQAASNIRFMAWERQPCFAPCKPSNSCHYSKLGGFLTTQDPPARRACWVSSRSGAAGTCAIQAPPSSTPSL